MENGTQQITIQQYVEAVNGVRYRTKVHHSVSLS